MESKINALLQEKFKEEDFQDCFLVAVNVTKGNKLEVFIDSDSGISFKKCRQLSRYLEQFIDEEKWLGEKYTLEVSSPGITRPLKFARQYPKNINRTLQVKLKNGSKKEGILKEVSDLEISLEEKIKVQEGKKKKTQTIISTILFEDIKETKVKITF